MMKESVSIHDYQNYLKQKYEDAIHTQALFMKLVEEIGEVAEAINKKTGRKHDDGESSLAEELVDVVHYAIAIAAVNDIDFEKTLLEKDKQASQKYKQTPNLQSFIKSAI
ncbi:MazG nucleotide pyrophosphohydrolase domain-containing protein [Erysipelothrix anatis]|uniref:MazG nucleotide pyrophosphohydrolase domain-containing protein n=1 Tax=Erysipelothrix anatis TaxID=2683713 RepID=UPI001356CF41|nr:MazG nucleotide pyrophosphohydrolase domain-containing protein [Erysipelothrix anatis]